MSVQKVYLINSPFMLKHIQLQEQLTIWLRDRQAETGFARKNVRQEAALLLLVSELDHGRATD